MKNSIIIDGREMTIAEFQFLTNLSVSGSLYLTGTGIPSTGEDRRGYEFFAVRLATGPRVIAGCRNFSPTEARAHWVEGSQCRALAEQCIAVLEGTTS